MNLKYICLLYILSAASCISCETGLGQSIGGYSIGVSSVTISRNSLSLFTGKKAQLEFAVLPANAGNPAIRWLSSDASIADVTGTGLVKGIAPGTAVISAVSVDSPDKRGQCTVTVSNPPDFTETRATASSDYTTPGGTAFRFILSPDIASGAVFPFGRRFINGGYEPERDVSVPTQFMLADAETTYELWKEVYDWATDSERGAAVYSFADPGRWAATTGETSHGPQSILSDP